MRIVCARIAASSVSDGQHEDLALREQRLRRIDERHAGQHVEPDAKTSTSSAADHELRHRDQRERRARDDVVERAVLRTRREHAEEDRQRDQQRAGRSPDRIAVLRDAGVDDRARTPDRRTAIERPEVALEDAAEPVDVALERPARSRPKSRAVLREQRRRRVAPERRLRGVAGQRLGAEEHDRRDDQQDRERREGPGQDRAGHRPPAPLRPPATPAGSRSCRGCGSRSPRSPGRCRRARRGSAGSPR